MRAVCRTRTKNRASVPSFSLSQATSTYIAGKASARFIQSSLLPRSVESADKARIRISQILLHSSLDIPDPLFIRLLQGLLGIGRYIPRKASVASGASGRFDGNLIQFHHVSQTFRHSKWLIHIQVSNETMTRCGGSSGEEPGTRLTTAYTRRMLGVTLSKYTLRFGLSSAISRDSTWYGMQKNRLANAGAQSRRLFLAEEKCPEPSPSDYSTSRITFVGSPTT